MITIIASLYSKAVETVNVHSFNAGLLRVRKAKTVSPVVHRQHGLHEVPLMWEDGSRRGSRTSLLPCRLLYFGFRFARLLFGRGLFWRAR
ncbi:MAG: hypothetical protein PVJ27_11420, partial [Candidatus Brocadiaceae bacterium]